MTLNDHINSMPGTPTVHVYANKLGGYDVVLNIDGGYADVEDAERMAQFTTDQLRARGLRVQCAEQ